MKKIVLLFIALRLFMADSFSQQLPYGTCGILNSYDAAGNRTQRVYFCNNGGPYPAGPEMGGSAQGAKTEKVAATEFQYVDALYPNPTSGFFSVTFSKALLNAAISISDNNGKRISSFSASGTKVDFDLSVYAAGVYYINIEEDGKTITKKVIKQ